MLVVQLDGVGAEVLRQGMVAGDVPTLSRWLREGSHRGYRWHTGLPATTGLPSPPVFLNLQGGARTDKYRLGGDEVLMDGDKPAGISVEDLAVTILDEIEKPAHIRRRFTVAG